MRFQCTHCQTILSVDLEEALEIELCEKDREDLVPSGFATQDLDWGDEGVWLINANDILNMKVTDDATRTNGCCDLDGGDGPNLRCEQCDAYVATARYDCWMPRYVRMDNENTKLVKN